MSRRKKICFVLQSLSAGGIESLAYNYANYFDKDDEIEFTLVLMHKKNHFYKVPDSTKIVENPHERKANKVTYALKSVFFLRKTFKKSKFDAVVVNGEWITTYVYIVTFGLIEKIFLADHSNPLRPNQNPLPFFNRIAYRFCTGVLVNSLVAKQKIHKLSCNRNIHIVDNLIDIPTVERSNDLEDFCICVGRLSSEKGQDVLVNAAKYLKNSDFKVYIIGDGKTRNELISLVERNNISNIVHILGRVEDLSYYFSRAKFYVLPSHTENFPLALIEAMSIGLPVIMSDCISWRGDDQFIEHMKNGIIVAKDNPEALAEAIDYLIENEDLREQFGQEALKIRERFNQDGIVNDFLKAINVHV